MQHTTEIYYNKSKKLFGKRVWLPLLFGGLLANIMHSVLDEPVYDGSKDPIKEGF
jgi:hypothetical protein